MIVFHSAPRSLGKWCCSLSYTVLAFALSLWRSLLAWRKESTKGAMWDPTFHEESDQESQSIEESRQRIIIKKDSQWFFLLNYLLKFLKNTKKLAIFFFVYLNFIDILKKWMVKQNSFFDLIDSISFYP